MAVLAFGAIGTFVELLLLGHYEEAWQLTPLVLIATSLITLAWLAVRPSAVGVRLFQSVMIMFLFAGVLGILLHVRGAGEFQWEMDPSQTRWTVFTKAVRSKAPPALAPGVMLQLGLIGLVGTYRHPAVTGSEG